MKCKCQGIKWWGRYDDWADGGMTWAVYGPEVTDEEINERYPAYSGGPGREFAHRAWIQRHKMRTLVRQMFGLDV